MKKLLFILLALSSLSLSAQRRGKDYSNILKSNSIYEIDAFLRDAHEDDPKRDILKPRLMELIEDYLKNAYPEDQQIPVLQQKLALLKSRPSTKISFDEMNETIRQKVRKKRQEDLARLQAKREGVPFPEPEKENESKNDGAEIASNTGGSSTTAKVPAKSNTLAAAIGSSKAGSIYKDAGVDKAEFERLMNESDDVHKEKTVKVLNALFDNDPNSKETTVLINNDSDCDMIVKIEGINSLSYKLAVPAKKNNTVVIKKGDYLFSGKVCGADYASQKTVKKSTMVTLRNPN